MSARVRSAARRGRASGFTLVELTVSLVAGLVVAMAIVGLSREATNTFHEEARSSAAEASLRTAVDRLRADLQRAGFMSTGNITVPGTQAGAPRIAHLQGSALNFASTAPAGIRTLASLSLNPGGSFTQNGLALSAQQTVPVTPDILRITGNMTTADQFDVASIGNAAAGCTRIYLVANSPAMFRVVGSPFSATANADLQRIFFPSSLATSQYQFVVRLVDTNQCAQYLATCKNSNVAGIDTTQTPNLPYVDVDLTTPVITANASGGNCGFTGFGEGCSVNPVQTVQWEIASQTQGDPEPTGYANLGGTAAAANKYDLMRSFIAADGTLVSDTSEIIAEYAVDLSFAFSVETGLTALAPAIQTYPFDSNLNYQWAPLPANLAANPPNIGPERIRSVRARIVTRAALADRVADIPPAPANYPGQEFAYRYCLSANGCATNPNRSLIFARTRTITTEVALPNQAGNFY
jgi:Tfp pilus assembly protein PilW